jgi:uncharacterized repeat protein (TIGR03803 family)
VKTFFSLCLFIFLATSALADEGTSAYNVLYNFGSSTTDGTRPVGELTEFHSMLYGVTFNGGAHNAGTFYTLNSSGQERTLYSFKGGDDAAGPAYNDASSTLVNLHGIFIGTTTGGGGACNCGTVYGVTTLGQEVVIHGFKGAPDGANPLGGLVRVGNAFYGTTTSGGKYNRGTIYKIDLFGRESVVYSFQGGYGGNLRDGGTPSTGLTEVNGHLYGTTTKGGPESNISQEGNGSVFDFNPFSNQERVLHFFTTTSAIPNSKLIYVNGRLYGTTRGYDGNDGTPGGGVVYEISLSGHEFTLYTFPIAGTSAGQAPNSVIYADGKLYGTTIAGGTYHGGSIFELTLSGHETDLHSFQSATGAGPYGELLEINHTLYGVTFAGGANYGAPNYAGGVLYSLTLPRK